MIPQCIQGVMQCHETVKNTDTTFCSVDRARSRLSVGDDGVTSVGVLGAGGGLLGRVRHGIRGKEFLHTVV